MDPIEWVYEPDAGTTVAERSRSHSSGGRGGTGLRKAVPRSLWWSMIERWPTLAHDSVAHHVYLPSRPWLYRLSTPEFQEWFRSQSEPQADGCRIWRPDDFRVTLDAGWSDSAERIAWCLANRHEPGDWLLLFRDCPNERCVRPEHLFFVGQLRDFYRRVHWDPSGCWLWQGARTRDGYGRYCVDGGEIGAHVYAWAYENVLVPPGLCVCHTCDTPACVNPRHLFCTNHRGNMADMVAKGRQARGARHPQARISPELTYLALQDLLSGIPVREFARRFFVSESSLRTLLRGEHWTQCGTQSVWGKSVDLGKVKIPGHVEYLLDQRDLDGGYCEARFRFQPTGAAIEESQRKRTAIECRAVFSRADRGLIDLLAPDRGEIVLGGALAPYAGLAQATRHPTFELRVLHIWDVPEASRQTSVNPGATG